MKITNFKQNLLNGESIELTNDMRDLIYIWFQPKTNNYCLELNSKVIKATKTYAPIHKKLTELRAINEYI